MRKAYNIELARLTPGAPRDPPLPGPSWRAMSHLFEHQIWLNTGGRFGCRLELRPRAWGPNVRTDLWDANLRGMDFSRAVFSDVIFASCSFRLTRLHGAELRNVRFICCELEGCDFSQATLDEVVFEAGSNYKQAYFAGAQMQRVEWNGPAPPGLPQASSISYPLNPKL